MLCADLATAGSGIDLAATSAWAEAAIPGARVRIVPDLCRGPVDLSAHLAQAPPDRLVLGLCAPPRAYADLQARARRVGLDPFLMEIVDLGTYAARVHPRPQATAKAKVMLAGAVARARAARPSRPEHTRPRLSVALSRRALLRLTWLEYEGLPAPAAERCRVDRGCTACVEACPRAALRAADGAIEVDRQRCAACGICVTACPHEAMELPGAAPAQVEAQVAALLTAAPAEVAPRAIVFTCRHSTGGLASLARRGRAYPPGWLPVEVPCVAMVPPMWLLAALALGAAGVAILPAAAGCPERTAEEAEARVDYCRAVLDRLGQPRERVAVLPAAGPALEEALHALAGSVWPLAPAAPCGPSGPPDRPLAPAARAQVLFHLAEACGSAAAWSVAHTRSVFGMVEAAEGCTLCGNCAAACPTEALRLSRDEDGVTLAFAPAECTGCGRCVSVCPEPSGMRMTRLTDLVRLGAGPRVLARSPHRRCAACGAPFAPEAVVARIAAILHAGPTISRLVTRYCPDCRPLHDA
jgi:Fe-S-cluster-containing hydrogenase component 2